MGFVFLFDMNHDEEIDMGIIYICVRVFVCGLWMEREKRIAFRATGSDSLFCLQV